MWPWYLMLLVPGISALLDKRVIKLQGVGKQRQINVGFTLSVTIMFFFRAFRAYTVGGDLYYYRLLFNFMGNDKVQLIAQICIKERHGLQSLVE